MGHFWGRWKHESWDHCNNWCFSNTNITSFSGGHNILHPSKVSIWTIHLQESIYRVIYIQYFLFCFVIMNNYLLNRLNDENGPRKVSRSSTNQLIADVANGLAAHIEGKIVQYHHK